MNKSPSRSVIPDQVSLCTFLRHISTRVKAWCLIHACQVSSKQLPGSPGALVLCLVIRNLKHMLNVSPGGRSVSYLFKVPFEATVYKFCFLGVHVKFHLALVGIQIY